MKELLQKREEILKPLRTAKRLLIIGDDDADGIIAAHLLSKYVSRLNPYVSILISFPPREDIDREVEQHKNYTPVFLDTRPKKFPEGSIFIDHHPVDAPENVYAFNPHLLGIKDASRYNTGFLVYLLFRDEIEKGGDLWKVAVSSYHDASYDFLRNFFKEFDMEKIKKADNYISAAVPNEIPHLLSLLERSKTLDEFLSDEKLKEIAEERERIFKELLNNYEKYCVHCEGRRIILLLPEEYSIFKNSLSTALSFRNPEKIIAVGTKKGQMYDFSLRFQGAEKEEIHLGKMARELSQKWGGSGGGHAPAAGIKFKEEHLKEFLELLKQL